MGSQKKQTGPSNTSTRNRTARETATSAATEKRKIYRRKNYRDRECVVSHKQQHISLEGSLYRTTLVALLPRGRGDHLGTRRSPSLPLHRPSRRSARTYPARGRHPRPRQPARHRARRRRPRPRRRRRKLRQRRPALPRCTMWRSRRAVSARKQNGISTTRAKALTETHEESFLHTVS